MSQGPLQELIGLAKAASQRRDWPEAALLWNQILDQSPGHIQAYVGAGNALRECGQHDAAERLLEIAAGYFPDHPPIAIARGWTANARRDWPVAIRRWDDVCVRFPRLPQGYSGMAQALKGANRLAELEPFLAAAQKLLDNETPESGQAQQPLDAKFEIARLRSDWSGLRVWAAEIIARDAAPAASVFVGLSQASWHLGDAEAAETAALNALAINPELTEALLVLVRVATERGDGEAALSLYQRLAALHPNASTWPLKRVQLLNWLGQLDLSLSEAEQLLERWPHDPMVRVFLRNYGLADSLPLSIRASKSQNLAHDPDEAERRELQILLDRSPAERMQARPVINADPRRDVIIADAAPSSTAVLIFTGAGDSLAMPLPVFDRYLTPLNLTPIYLRDFHRLRYMAGIRSLGETYQATIDGLRRLLRQRGVSRLYTFGNCAGGFAAIRYGVELGAERILAFDAPTHCPEEALTRLDQGQNFIRRRLLSLYPGEMTDLKPFLAARHAETRIDIFYQNEDRLKRLQAERLGDVPGIQLHPQPGLGNNHLLRKIALLNDDFCQWLADLMPVEAV